MSEKIGTKKTATGAYEIGFCKPPVGAKWQPGKSANPSGRPKRKPSPHEVFMEQAMKRMSVNVGGKHVKMSMFEVNVLSLFKKGNTGDVKAIELALQFAVAAHAAITGGSPPTEEKVSQEQFSWDEEQEELFQTLMKTELK